MSGPYFKRHWPYPEVHQEPEQRTWTPPERTVFPGCSDRVDCECACAVGVRTVGSGVYGCDCVGHDAKRARLAPGG